MKRLLSAICIMVFVVSLWGCNDGSFNPMEEIKWTTAPEENRLLSTEAIEETSSLKTETVDLFRYYSDIRYAERYWWASLSEFGAFNDHTDNNLLDIVAKDSGEDVIFCSNLGCKHPDYSVGAGTPECMAARYSDPHRTAYYNGMLYFFVSKGLYEHWVYVMDITTGERNLLAAMLPFRAKVGHFTIFKDDKMYYEAEYIYKDEITGKGIYKYRIIEMNLHDGSYRFLTEETEDLYAEAHIVGDKFWVRIADQSDNGRLYTEIIDINTLETTIVIDKHEWEIGNHYIDVKDEDSYYYWDKITYKIGIRNIDGTVEKILLQGAEGEDFCPRDPSGDKLFYTRKYDYGDEKAGTYLMDLTTGEVIDITEEAGKYNLLGYDYYYDSFIAVYEDVEMWSREKILEEALAG